MKRFALLLLFPLLVFSQDVDFGPPDPLRDSQPIDYWIVAAMHTKLGPMRSDFIQRIVPKNVDPVMEQQRPVDSVQQNPGGFGRILNRLQWRWEVISANRPLVTTNFNQYAEALPRDAKDYSEVIGWKKPIMVPVKAEALNGMQIRVATVRYSIQFSYGGSFRGRGKYIANVMVIPQRISVLPGFHVDLSAQVLAILNYGTVRNPIAGMQLVIIEKVSSMIADKTDTRSFLIRGDGVFQELHPEKH